MTRKKMPVDIDWNKVILEIERSLIGKGTEEGHVLLEAAWKSDPEKYRELHLKLKRQAHASINPMLRDDG